MEYEIWKDIPSYEGRYQASTLGRIKSLSFGGHKGLVRLLKQQYFHNGYCYVILLGLKKYVHRLIAMTFLEDFNEDLQIDHINTIKDDNRICNLRACSAKENCNNPITRKHLLQALNSNDYKSKMSNVKKGYVMSEETKLKLSRLHIGRKWYIGSDGKEHW